MNSSAHSANMHSDGSWQFRWPYAISDARSEPIPINRPSRQIPTPSAPSPPPQSAHSQPTEIEPGVWFNDGETLYASNWPPVQEYLNEVREQRYLVDPPSEIIFALAALDVIKTCNDPAHWIFFSDAKRRETLLNVNKIASHQPRLIKPSFPWLGIAEIKHILVPLQLKFEYIHIRRQWYPIEGVVVETKKRALRSSGDVPEVPTPEEFFNLLKPEEIPRKKSANRKTKPKPTNPAVEQESDPTAKPSSLTVTPVEVLPVAEQITEVSAYVSPPRSSTRVRRKVTPTSRAPRIVSNSADASASTTTPSPASPSSPPITSPTLSVLSSTSSHSRSTSQSSVKTAVESTRSVSVLSSDTVVETSSSRKRKAENGLEKVDEETEQDECASTGTERMVTRGRTSKKVRSLDIERDSTSSRTSTPTLEIVVKAVPRRARAKKAGV